jgi:hypothetical protein
MNILIGVYPLGIVIYKFLPIFRQKNWHVGKHYMYGVLISMICGIAMLAPQFITWQYLYHSWFTVYIQSGHFTTIDFKFIPYLFWRLYWLVMVDTSVFCGNPWQFLVCHQTTLAGVLFLLTTIIFISYNAGIPDWDGSGGFGFRRIISLVPFFAFGLATIFHALQRWRLLPAVSAVVMMGWTIRIMVRYMEFKFFAHQTIFLTP